MNRPWMPLYIADYRADTAHLSAAQHGAYLLLIMHYWQTGGLPNDEPALARIACMTSAEWKRNRPVVAAFFSSKWTHRRIDSELARALEISSKRSASAKQRHSKTDANAEQLDTHARASPQSHKDSDAEASGDLALADPRMRLFRDGLSRLARLTGKGPDACRSFVGKCLKAAGDDAVTVLGLIEEAERNQVVDPSAWIAARLKGPLDGKAPSRIIQAADDLRRKIASFDGPASGNLELCDGAGASATRLLPDR